MKKFYSLFLALAAMTLSLSAQTTYVDGTSGFSFQILGGDSAKIVYNDSYASKTSISVPTTVKEGSNTYRVVEIGEGAFANCTNLTAVELGYNSDSRHSPWWRLGKKAFFNCPNITWLDFYVIDQIGDSAFADCRNLSFDSGSWDDFGVIGANAFENCTGGFFQTVILGISLTSIGDCAFKGCTSITDIYLRSDSLINGPSKLDKRVFKGLENNIKNIDLQEAVKYIPLGMFYGMNNAEITLTCPSTKGMYRLKEIGADAFSGCVKMTDEIIGKLFTDALTFVGNGAFDGCSAVTELVLPKNLSDIEGYAFSGMTNLKTVYAMRPTPPVISESVFSGCGDLSKIDLKVTDATYAAYSTANVWKQFNVVPDGGFWKLVISVEHAAVKVVDAETEDELDPDKIANNTTVKFVVTPDEGYVETYGWDYNHGKPLTVLKNQTIEVGTRIKKFNLHFRNDGNGTISIKKDGENFTSSFKDGGLYDYFTEFELTATPTVKDYKFKGWYGTNGTVRYENPLTVTVNDSFKTGQGPNDGVIDLTAKFELESATGIDDNTIRPNAVKHIVNGQLLIERDGKIFNTLGVEIK